LRILVAIPCLLTGGTEMQTLALVRVLRSCSHAVYIVCYFEYEISVVKEFKTEEAEVRLLELDREGGFGKTILSLRNEIRKIDPDIVHVQYMAPGALPIIAARLAGVKTIFATVHQPYTKSHGRFARYILRIASGLTTRFIAVSMNAEKSWFGSSNLFNENIPLKTQPHHFTIYNAVDTGRIREIAERANNILILREFGIPDGKPIIGTISRLRYEKGIDILIEAFDNLVSRGIEAHLLIVGSGPDENLLKEKVKLLKISERVAFVGSASWEMAMRLLSLMDIVAIPSRFEGFGLTAAEAMATGKPVVASGTFGLDEVITDGLTGFLVQPANILGFSEKFEELIKDEELRIKLGREGQRKAMSIFSFEVFRNKIRSLYGELPGIKI
jgi:L-malate glycosyltransferase